MESTRTTATNRANIEITNAKDDIPKIGEDTNAKDITELADLKLDALTTVHVYAYGVGHFLNDLCAACWFNYLLFYLKSVQPIGTPDEAGTFAGIVLLAGQLADGIFTPIVGYLSDKINTRCGKRMPWYYFGFVTVCVSFWFIFLPCQFCIWFQDTEAVRLIYYITFPSLFNIGWAAMQVSHMALVPSLTMSRVRRDILNNLRTTFTFVANLWVLLFAFFLFAVVKSPTLKFQILAQGTLLLGAASSIFFMCVIHEKQLTRACRKLSREYKLEYSRLAALDAQEEQQAAQEETPLLPKEEIKEEESPAVDSESLEPVVHTETSQRETKEPPLQTNEDDADAQTKRVSSILSEPFQWYLWFREWQFYAYGLVYMGARIYCNVITSLLLFYLKTVLQFGHETAKSNPTPISFAIIPMLIYISSSILTIKLKSFYLAIGRKKTYSLGAILVIISSATFLVLTPTTSYFVFPLALLIGFAQSIILNTSVAYIGEVIGQKGGSGAFVYGFYSLLDKAACGIILFFIMRCKDVDAPTSVEYVRWTFTITPFVGAMLAWFGIYTGGAKDYDSASDAVNIN